MSPLLPLALALAADPAQTILEKNCLACHSSKVSLSGLDLSTRDAALKGGARGPAIVPGNPAASRLIAAIERKDAKLAMPPTKALQPAEVEAVRQWIQKGAEYTGAAAAPASTWWSFQRPKKITPPRTGHAWVKNEIDEFILATLNAQKLQPSPAADRRTLLRRVTFDLTGLPPTPAELKAFTGDQSPNAWSTVVERLLASQHYGEKWGRHWLDLARYSDTAGFELDSYIHDAWRYRDYVIESFNADKPYDRFIREQIAGDELFLEDPVSQTGTGLFCVGPNRDLFPDQADINREEILTDYVDTTSQVFLGLTAGCARCHDHKFDPLPQRDYFQVRAIFAPAVKTNIALNRLGSLGHLVGESVREWKLREIGENIRASQTRCRAKLLDEKLSKLSEEVRTALKLDDNGRTARQRELATEYANAARVTDEEIRACQTPGEAKELQTAERALVRMFGDYRSKPFACGLNDMSDVSPKTFIPARNGKPKQEVEPGFFSVLAAPGQTFIVPPPPEDRVATGPIPLAPTTGRRSALAQWIASPDNPLTARVMVNRIWQYHFGRGIVATPSDFGTRGRAPSHPELLDWLAGEFVNRGWSMKQIHRLILNSAAYQQAAGHNPQDPENQWLSHFTRRRLSADEIRDASLTVTGQLNKKMYGRPVVTPLSKQELENLTQRPDDAWVLTKDATEHPRRSIYLIQKRTFRLPMMEVFDQPESMLTCSRRESSTTAPQSLTLFNGDFALEQSKAWATKLTAEHATNPSLINAVWDRAYLRAPTATEASRAVAFLEKQQSLTGSRQDAARELIRGVLNTNEFLYLD